MPPMMRSRRRWHGGFWCSCCGNDTPTERADEKRRTATEIKQEMDDAD